MNEVQEFLTQWILEFGGGPVHIETLQENDWYSGIPLSCLIGRGASYFDRVVDRYGNDVFQINQTGLDFIKEGRDE